MYLVSVVQPLRITNVMHGDHALCLTQCAGTDATKLLHVATGAKKQTEMDTKGTNVRASFARHLLE